eukprot:8893176-Pyramimonas_sp.AAC.1
MGAGTAMRVQPLGPYMEPPMVPRNDETCEGVPKGVRGPRASSAAGTLGGAPVGATKRERGMPNWVRGPLGVPTLGPQCAKMGAGTACEFRRWDFRLSSRWGHETHVWGVPKSAMGPPANSADGTL